MKKMTLMISMILSLGVMALPSHSKGFNGAATQPVNGIRFAYATEPNSSFVYCHYEYYNLKTGVSAGYAYNRMYVRSSFRGCPAS